MWARQQIIRAPCTSATISYVINSLSTYGTEKRFFGKTNPEVSERYDTLVTPKGWAFAIWAFIFIGEAIGLIFIWTNNDCATEFHDILIPFAYACILQSLWCICFSKEQILLSALVLTGISYNLKNCCDEIFKIAVSGSISKVPYIAEAFVSYPIRIHFAWTTAAALINWNMLIVSYRIPDLEVFPALISIWTAAGIAAFRALFLGDAIFPAVLAWAFTAMSAKIRSSPPESFKRDSPFLKVKMKIQLTMFIYSFISIHASSSLLVSESIFTTFSFVLNSFFQFLSFVAVLHIILIITIYHANSTNMKLNINI